jgi:hypothetical protein
MKIRFLMIALAITWLLAFVLPAPSSAQIDTVKLKVKRLLLDPSSKTPIVVLESLKSKKFFRIWIGKAEANSIFMELEHVKIPRPNTHDLVGNIVKELGATLDRITITELRNNTYYAVITLKLMPHPRYWQRQENCLPPSKGPKGCGTSWASTSKT